MDNPLPENDSPSVEFGIDLGRRPDLDLKTFPGRRRIHAAVSPDSSYQLLKSALDSARLELLIYIYNVSAEHMLTLVRDARARGVKVQLMYDSKDTAGGEVQKLKSLKVPLKVAPSRDPRRVFDVCHQKFAVVDGEYVVLGSANWAGTAIPLRLPGKPRKNGNREWLIRVDDKKVAGWFKRLFELDWAIPEFSSFGVEFDLEGREALVVPAPSFDPPSDLPVTELEIEGDLTPVVSPDNYFTYVKAMLEQAQRRILVEQQYIVGGTQAPSIEKFLGILKAKKAQGLEVRIIVSSRFASGWEKSKASVERHGLSQNVKAINLDTFVHCHNKGVIVDDEVVISSTNWSENSVRRAREAGVAIKNRELTSYYASGFDDDWDNGWTIAQGDAGPSFDLVADEDRDMEIIHPADEE